MSKGVSKALISEGPLSTQQLFTEKYIGQPMIWRTWPAKHRIVKMLDRSSRATTPVWNLVPPLDVEELSKTSCEEVVQLLSVALMYRKGFTCVKQCGGRDTFTLDNPLGV